MFNNKRKKNKIKKRNITSSNSEEIYNKRKKNFIK